MSKAPDKIYLAVDKNENWKYAIWTTRCPQEQKFSELDKHEEYIRKDALLEWAKKENLKFNHTGNEQDDNFARGVAAGLGYLISKLSSL